MDAPQHRDALSGCAGSSPGFLLIWMGVFGKRIRGGRYGGGMEGGEDPLNHRRPFTIGCHRFTMTIEWVVGLRALGIRKAGEAAGTRVPPGIGERFFHATSDR